MVVTTPYTNFIPTNGLHSIHGLWIQAVYILILVQWGHLKQVT